MIYRKCQQQAPPGEEQVEEKEKKKREEEEEEEKKERGLGEREGGREGGKEGGRDASVTPVCFFCFFDRQHAEGKKRVFFWGSAP